MQSVRPRARKDNPFGRRIRREPVSIQAVLVGARSLPAGVGRTLDARRAFSQVWCGVAITSVIGLGCKCLTIPTAPQSANHCRPTGARLRPESTSSRSAGSLPPNGRLSNEDLKVLRDWTTRYQDIDLPSRGYISSVVTKALAEQVLTRRTSATGSTSRLSLSFRFNSEGRPTRDAESRN